MMGFMAKLSVLQAVLATGQTWLALIAVIFSLIGAYYYLRVVKVMWFDEPVDSAIVHAPLDMRVVMSLNGILVLVLGVLPGALLDACARAIRATMQF
jgi:NADH-quinone oxidoreductase subunit N